MVELFDRSRLTLRSACNRKSFVHLERAGQGLDDVPPYWSIDLDRVVALLKRRKGPKVWFFGGAVWKSGVTWYLKQLKPWMQHRATNGAGVVHYWELCHLERTSEDVKTAIKDGSFGMWYETAELNDVVAEKPRIGVGECIWGSPDITAHISIGQDIFHMYPNYNALAWGEAAYIDFLKFVTVVEGMQGGTFLVFGSAVCAPEVFLKALTMARNVNNGKPDDIAVVIFDCVRPPVDLTARWFHRPTKNLRNRVASESVFVHGWHQETIPNLWKALCV